MRRWVLIGFFGSMIAFGTMVAMAQPPGDFESAMCSGYAAPICRLEDNGYRCTYIGICHNSMYFFPCCLRIERDIEYEYYEYYEAAN